MIAKQPGDEAESSVAEGDARFALVALDSDVPEGGMCGTAVGDTPVLLVRLNGELHALGRICTHQDADLAEGRIEDGCVVCPLHGSKFDVVTGQALTLPAFEPEPVYDVRVREGVVYVAVPKDGD